MIQRLRKKLGMTQTALAEALEMNVGTLRNWEQGIYPPDAAARALLRILDREPAAALRALGAQPGRSR